MGPIRDKRGINRLRWEKKKVAAAKRSREKRVSKKMVHVD